MLKNRIALWCLAIGLLTLSSGEMIAETAAQEQQTEIPQLPADAADIPEKPQTMQATDEIRIRTAPTTAQNNAVGTLKKGEEVTVYARTQKTEDRVWAIIFRDGQWCYLADEYLTPSDETGTEEGAAGEPEANGTEGSSSADGALLDPAGDGIPVSDPMMDPYSGGGSEKYYGETAGPQKQRNETGTEEIDSYLNQGKVYKFTAYSDGSIEVEISHTE